jgi:hypothetical protein
MSDRADRQDHGGQQAGCAERHAMRRREQKRQRKDEREYLARIREEREGE